MGLVVLFSSFILCQTAFAKPTYTVKRGDSLAKISRTLQVSIGDLKAANGLKGTLLKPGEVLVVPGTQKVRQAKSGVSKQKKSAAIASRNPKPTRTYVVKRGESLHKIAAKTGVSVADIKRLNRLPSDRIRAGQRLALASPPSRDEYAPRSGRTPPSVDLLDEDALDDDEDNTPVGEEDWAAVEKDKLASSDLLGKWNNPGERELLVKVAKGFMGAPYRLGGDSVRGLDCSAFVKKIYSFFDVYLPRTAHEQSRVGKHVARGELVEGDLVFFHTRRPIGHVGIYIGNNEFVHAASGRSRRVRVNSLDEPYYSKHFVKAMRLKGLDDGA
jgi:cell wall-associated NlpC family hydrolase